MEIGTLKELEAAVGDVVEYTPTTKRTTITRIDGDDYYGSGINPDMPYNPGPWFRIISRASQPTPDLTAITTPFGLLDEVTRDAMRAHGGPYEYWNNLCKWNHTDDPAYDFKTVYRVKAGPVIENAQVNIYCRGHKATAFIQLKDGEPEWGTLKVQAR